MASKFSKSAAALAFGMAFIVTPALLDTTSPFAIDSAFAKQGGNGDGNGNGNGNSGGNGNGNGNGGSGSASSSQGNSSTKVANTEKATKIEKATKVNHGAIASQLGALNAAHASPQAFAHASLNSRVGKIKSYYLANQEALTAQIAADATDALALQAGFEGSAPANIVDAYEALQADPGNVALQDAYNQAVTDAALTGGQVAALETAYTDWQNAVEADALAATAEAEAEAALNTAANKTPVSDETRAALDALLVGKITEVAIEQ
jgi:hypothetical protein